MRASELVCQLNELIAIHGDIDVVIDDNNTDLIFEDDQLTEIEQVWYCEPDTDPRCLIVISCPRKRKAPRPKPQGE